MDKIFINKCGNYKKQNILYMGILKIKEIITDRKFP